MDISFNCPECGKKIICDPSTTCLCYYCGEEVKVPLNAIRIENSNREIEKFEYACSNCGEPVSLTARVCSNCGDILEDDEFVIPELVGVPQQALVEIREPRRDVLIASLFSTTHGFVTINGIKSGRLPIVPVRECNEQLLREGWKLVTTLEDVDDWWNIKRMYYGMSGGKYQFHVTPRDPVEFRERAKKETSFCGGYLAKGFGAIALLVTLALAAVQISLYTDPYTPAFPILAHIIAWFIIAGGLAVSVYMLWNGYKGDQQQVHLATLWMTNNESIKLSKELNGILENSEDIVLNRLPSYLTDALSFLDQSETNYMENAFGPFWDSVENAAQSIAAFYRSIQVLDREAAAYTQKLMGRQHNFPPYMLPNSVPAPDPVLTRFTTIVRRGQTNFQFASIWEQRKTRQAIVEGFVTLDEAVNGLASRIEFSMQELQRRIS